MTLNMLNGTTLIASSLLISTSISAFAEDYIAPPMVNIPAGSFMMGSDLGKEKNKPRHSVTLPAFQMGKYLVTVNEFRKFVQDSGYTPKSNCHDTLNEHWMGGKYEGTASWDKNRYLKNDYQPVTCVTWDEANAYAVWLTEKTGTQYRLPTEQEWEYSVKANTSSVHFWGDDPNLTQACKYGNFGDQAGEYYGSKDYGASYVGFIGHANCDDGEGYNTLVGLYRPNPFGLYDMHGNVRQLLGTCYYPGYKTRTAEEMDTDNCEEVAFRGTIWHFTPEPNHARAGFKKSKIPNAILGFRLAVDGHSNKEDDTSKVFEVDLNKVQSDYLANRIKLPEAPTHLQLKQTDNGQFLLSWNVNKDKSVNAFDVYQSTTIYSHRLGGFFEKHYNKIASVNSNQHSMLVSLPSEGGSFKVIAVTDDATSLPSEPAAFVQPKTLTIPGKVHLHEAATMENAHLKLRAAKDDKPDLYYLLKYTGEEQVVTTTTFNVNVKKSAMYNLNYRGKIGGKGEFFKLWQGNKLIGVIDYDKDIDDKSSNRHQVFLEKGVYTLEMTVKRNTPDRWFMVWLDFTEA